MKIGDRVYIVEALAQIRPGRRTTVAHKLRPGSKGEVTGWSSTHGVAAVKHDDGTHGVYFRNELIVICEGKSKSGTDAVEQMRQWLRFYELLLPDAGAEQAAEEADEAMAKWLAKQREPKADSSSTSAELRLSAGAVTLLKEYRLLCKEFPLDCSTEDSLALDAVERKLLAAILESPETK